MPDCWVDNDDQDDEWRITRLFCDAAKKAAEKERLQHERAELEALWCENVELKARMKDRFQGEDGVLYWLAGRDRRSKLTVTYIE